MNPLVFIYLAAAAVVIAVSVPLILGKIPRNEFYGVRIPTTLASDEAWYAVNRVGGLWFFAWGAGLAAIAVLGAFVPRAHWAEFAAWSTAYVFLGLGFAVWRILRFARRFRQR